jgi:antitoxin ParD1/3/4
MSKSTSVSLSDHFNAFVETQVASGRFDSASEVVRAGLRLLEEREARIAGHCAWLCEGEVTGERSSPDRFGEEIGAVAREEEREARVRALKAAIQAGLDSGPPQPFDFDEFLASKRAPRVRNA